jgi:putative transposase
MPRRLRAAAGGYAYHIINRAVRRATLFRKDSDYTAFEAILGEAPDFQPMRLLAYCLMPNHWHLVLWPRHDGDLSTYMRWLTVTHTQRYHADHHSAGTGPLYQGRFKSFPIQEGQHLRTVCRYVERNPLRAGLVRRAEAWRWSSLGRREQDVPTPRLSDWPDGRPERSLWLKEVNRVETEAEMQALRRSVERGTPFGEERWTERTATRLGLDSTLRPRGRPRKAPSEKE